MKSTAVLILSTERSGGLVEILLDIGLEPLVRKDIQETLYKLRRERLGAIFVDRNRVDVDPLEFVLNVRDVDPEITIVIVGESSSTSEDLALKRQPGVFLLEAEPDRLGGKLETHLQSLL